MTKYYAVHPRNFANEYTLVSVSTDVDAAAIQQMIDNAQVSTQEGSVERVTVKQMRAMQAAERLSRKYDQSFSGYCNLDPIPAAQMLCDMRVYG